MPTKQTIVGRMYLKDHPEHAIFVCLELGMVQTWSVTYWGRNGSSINERLRQSFPANTINLTGEILEINTITDLKTAAVLSLIKALWRLAPPQARGPCPNADTALSLYYGIEREEEKIWKEAGNY